MPTIIEVAEALGKQIREKVSDTKVHDTPPDVLRSRKAAIWVTPGEADHVQPEDTHQDRLFDIKVAVIASTAEDGWRALSPYLDNSGALSIKAAIYADSTLGLTGVQFTRVQSDTGWSRSVDNVNQYEATMTVLVHFDDS